MQFKVVANGADHEVWIFIAYSTSSRSRLLNIILFINRLGEKLFEQRKTVARAPFLHFGQQRVPSFQADPRGVVPVQLAVMG